MLSSPRGARFWISAWLPVVLGVFVIVLESTEWMGSDHTDSPIRVLYQSIFGKVTDNQWWLIHHHIRKAGHFLGYGLIGMAMLRSWWMSLPRSRFLTDALLALAGTALLASLDEFHQSFLPNRTSTPWDVLVDCSGALTLQLLVYIFMRISRPKRLARAAYVHHSS